MLPLLWFLLVVLASRLLLILRDDPLTRRQALGLALVQGAALLTAAPDARLLPLLAVVLAANLAGAWLERRRPARAGLLRLGVLALVVLAAGFTFAPAQGLAASPALLAAGDWLHRYFLFLPAVGGPGAAGGTGLMLMLIGALAVMHEANLLIRSILQLIRVVPQTPAGDDAAAEPPVLILPPRQPGEPPQRLDQREYNAGRFIGVLERILTYAFVLHGQYTAIGLILAAKGFARFKEMDQRDFAEYVLIGTLLSMSAAVLVGEAVKALLP